ncbi:MAG TPA: FmdB family zinc ribbon protein, partial [Acidimicrobiia bacterium]|nr:FmdB family zinc ribbon protein [Acidimicrobiia bacterium]
MPTYEYRCKRCGEQFEVVQSFSAKPLKRHACGGDLQKVFHARGVVFKGSGFYSTDSRSSPSKKKDEPAKKTDSS